MAGLNQRATIWRILEAGDDAVGGAVITGSAVYTGVMTELEAKPPEQLLLQQGLETTKSFSAIVIPATLQIKERDEYEITFPPTDEYLNHRFRIVGVQYSSHTRGSPNAYIILQLIRSERAHTVQ